MTTQRKPARWLNYADDLPDVVGQVVGPELHGALLTIVTADHDPERDVTSVGLAFGVDRQREE